MADQATVHLGENSPEQVAFKLLELVALTEGQLIKSSRENGNKADRKWILDTYAECILAVRSPHGRE